MASKIVWFFGRRRQRGRGKARRLQIIETASKRNPGLIEFAAMPTGRVAHLMERGVNKTFGQRTGERARGSITRSRNEIGPFAGARTQGPSVGYTRTLSIAPRPFFMPAVESVGGASGVNSRLQGSLDNLAGSLNGA